MTEQLVDGGRVEFETSPEAINVIAYENGDEDHPVELRIYPSERSTLVRAMRDDMKTDVETADGGLIGWEPGKGLYLEDIDARILTLACSPGDREMLADAFANAEVGA